MATASPDAIATGDGISADSAREFIEVARSMIGDWSATTDRDAGGNHDPR